MTYAEFSKQRESYLSALKKAGLHTADEQGVVIVLSPEEAYEDDKKKVQKIAKETGYELSYGIRKKQAKA